MSLQVEAKTFQVEALAPSLCGTFLKVMRKRSISSKSRRSQGPRMLMNTRSSAPEEVLPIEASKKPSKCRKILEDTPSPQCENTTGLAIFPDELLLEILSYYPECELDSHEECASRTRMRNFRVARR